MMSLLALSAAAPRAEAAAEADHGYGAPVSSGYGAPKPTYHAPAASHGNEVVHIHHHHYESPKPTYDYKPTYHAPKPTYHAPSYHSPSHHHSSGHYDHYYSKTSSFLTVLETRR